MNGWIFIELVIVSFFLWTVIDPIYILTADKLIASGYDAHNRYRVRTVSGLFLPKIKKGATTHDEEENAADHRGM